MDFCCMCNGRNPAGYMIRYFMEWSNDSSDCDFTETIIITGLLFGGQVSKNIPVNGQG